MIRWGILGCGGIANTFAAAASEAVSESSIAAAAARSKDRASDFAAKYKIARHYGSYEELVSDPDLDAIYIATPHSHHYEHTMLCLNHGKHVLCEKALAVNLDEATRMFALAKERKLFLMEAMWMRFLPAMVYLRQYLQSGALGKVKKVTADFSFVGIQDPQRRLLNPQLAGGALLDVGIYPLSFSLMILGEDPLSVQGKADLAETGVDQSNSFVLEYADGKNASCTSSISVAGSKLALVECSEGVIEIPEFWRAQKLLITPSGKECQERNFPFDKNGFEYEIRHVLHCLGEAKLESDIMPASVSLNAIKIMDGLRLDWGLCYPMEKGN